MSSSGRDTFGDTGRRRCVVTGATGLVGQHLLPRLAVTHDVIALARTPGAPCAGVQWIATDLASEGALASLPARYDLVVSLAQSRRFREFPAGAADVLAVNVAAVERLASHAVSAGATHFVHCSSGGVYAPSDAPLAESHPLLPAERAGWYSASKIAAESLVHAYAPHLVPVVLRPFFVYGHGQARHMLVPRLADAVRDGRPVTLSSADGIRVSLTHADDMVDAILASFTLMAPATLNVAGPDALTLREIAEQFAAHHGTTPVFHYDTPDGTAATRGSARSCVADTGRLTDTLLTPARRFADHAPTVLR